MACAWLSPHTGTPIFHDVRIDRARRLGNSRPGIVFAHLMQGSNCTGTCNIQTIERCHHGIGEGVGMIGGHNQASDTVLHHLTQPPGTTYHQGASVRHRFKGNDAKGFVEGGKDRQIGSVVEAITILIRDEAGKMDARTDPKSCRLSLQASRLSPMPAMTSRARSRLVINGHALSSTWSPFS